MHCCPSFCATCGQSEKEMPSKRIIAAFFTCFFIVLVRNLCYPFGIVRKEDTAVINFDFDGDGRLDLIEHATARTYYEEALQEDFEDTLLDDAADLAFDGDDDYIFDPDDEDW